MIRSKRVYDPPEPEDGVRFLVQRLWPRGMPKASLQMHGWLKDVAPSAALRRWFGHDPAKWEPFCHRYFVELAGKPEAVQPLINAAQQGNVTLLYSARNTEHNNAIALKMYLEAQGVGQKKQPPQGKSYSRKGGV
jgi:uncharacterized protein YeaO (DUF488 family)